MTDFQLSLLIGGSVAVGAVWAYNKWQEVRSRRMAEAMLPAASGDALLKDVQPGKPRFANRHAASGQAADGDALDERVEPVLPMPIEMESREVLADDPSAVDEPAAGVPDQATALAESAVATRAAGRAEPPSRLVSPLIDYIAGFEVVEPVSGEQVALVIRDMSRALERRLIAVGQRADGEWELCQTAGAYGSLRIALQLADRSGPVAEASLDRFRGAMEDLADELLAVADLPSRKTALEIAQRLDAMCAGVDIQVGVNVVSGGAAFAGSKLRTLAETAGLVAAGDGTLVKRDDDGRVMFRVLNHDPAGFSADNLRGQAIPGITFLLDVPRVARADKVFNQMVELAGRFADTLGGTLVDDNRRPITEQYLSPIRKQILQYQGVLANHGLPAGSDLALRLFS